MKKNSVGRARSPLPAAGICNLEIHLAGDSGMLPKKTTDLNNPDPSRTWVFTDEHPDSIDDDLFYASSYPTSSFTELPGNQHDGAAGITFADGHFEMHKGTRAVVPNTPVRYVSAQRIPCSFSDPDMVWLAQHTPQPP
jgi:prepilin-type processing-associated H-X9-DG protein